jgi:hypothetical protein
MSSLGVRDGTGALRRLGFELSAASTQRSEAAATPIGLEQHNAPLGGNPQPLVVGQVLAGNAQPAVAGLSGGPTGADGSSTGEQPDLAVLTIEGQLKAKDEETSPSLSEHLVEMFFTRSIPPERLAASAGLTINDKASAHTGGGGSFRLLVAGAGDISGPTVRFVVSAPSGKRVDDESVAVGAIREPITLHVAALPRTELETPAKPDPPPVLHVTGRLVDTACKPVPSCLQVTVFGRPVTNGGGAGDPVPIMAARADRSGAFFGDVANQQYAEVSAVVSGGNAPIPVALEDGRIPARMMLVTEFPASDPGAPAADECRCRDTPPRTPTQADIVDAPDTYSVDLGTGGCVDFSTPNRAIEEFDFYTVVRTTQPDVRMLTLPDADRTPVANGNGSDVDGSTPVVAAAYDVRIDIRELEDPGNIRVSFVTTDGRRAVVLVRTSTSPLLTVGPSIRVPGSFEVSAEEFLLQTANPRRESWSVTENAGSVTAIGLDLRSVDHVVVEWAAPASVVVWALSGIGIAATSTTGARIPVLIEGSEFHTAEPWIHTFIPSQTSLGTNWEGAATIAAPATRPLVLRKAVAGALRGAEQRPIVSSEDYLAAMRAALLPPGRARLTADNAVDWDSTPTVYEAATVAHGHLLHFKQVWYADGYSLGDLLYSLPLAPGQKKLISVVDWERRERTSRQEFTIENEGVGAVNARDRDLGEVVTGALTESVRGGSRNTTVGVGAGTGGAGNGTYQGMNFGALLGVSGGYGDSDSDAWQVSGRGLAATSLQTLRDKTVQSASAVRSLRSSVVQTVSQGESTQVTTEVVANHNHCHALTVQYFEVLRHLKVTHELADVQECLFVPLPISPFDRAKVLRWRQALDAYLHRPELEPGFDAVRRVETNWSEVDYPAKRYGDEKVISISGQLEITLLVPLPPLPEKPKPRPEDSIDTVATAVRNATNPTTGFLGILAGIATGGATLIANAAIGAAQDATKAAIEGTRALAEELMDESSPQAKYDKFQHDVMPGVAAGFIDQLDLYALVDGAQVKIASADFTLVSEYRPAVPLLASVKATLPPSIARSDIQQLTIKSRQGLPPGCRAIVNTATMRYRTRLFEHALVDDRQANDDIDLPVVQVSFDTSLAGFAVTQVADGNGAALGTPMDAWEQRNPRTDDRALAATLIDHLNEQLEYYHHAIWWTMDPNRRYMLLDGYEAPGPDQRSLASVVENRLIGIVGNSLVLPVAYGVHLDPRLDVKDPSKPVDLRSLYPAPSIAPSRVSLPTRGVFAEAVMGNCNACETIDDSKFWRWEESPIDEPPSIEPASTATRAEPPATVTPTQFPTPIVSLQAPASVPDPAGVAAALAALGKESFTDITGLAGTQANAAAAYSKALDTALAFGKEASTLAQQASAIKSMDKTLATIDKAEAQKKIAPDDAERHRNDLIDTATGAKDAPPKTSEVKEKLDTLKKAEQDGSIGSSAKQKYSEVVAKRYVGDDSPSQTEEGKAATDVIRAVGRSGRASSVQTGNPPTTVTTHPEVELEPPGPMIPENLEQLITWTERGLKVGEIAEILSHTAELAPDTFELIEAAGSYLGLASAILSIVEVFVQLVNALDTGLRSDETMGWVYGITNAIDGKPGPTDLPPLDQPRDTIEARRARFDAGVERGRALILAPSTDDEREAAARLKIWLMLCLQDYGLLKGHRTFVTGLFRLAYKDGDQQHRETWYANWPEMRAAPGPFD